MERFWNKDGATTSSFAMSKTYLSVVAESGIVNLYSSQQKHAKSISNLQTSIDGCQFNSDGNNVHVNASFQPVFESGHLRPLTSRHRKLPMMSSCRNSYTQLDPGLPRSLLHMQRLIPLLKTRLLSSREAAP